MRPITRLTAIVWIAAASTIATAELAPPNAAGVSMGHLHYFVEDLDANRDFWISLGGTAAPFTGGALIRMPGVVVLLSEIAAETGPSVVDHVAFRVESLAAIEATGLKLEMVEAYPGIASIYAPSGDRIELFEEGTATNVGFDAERADPVADRHNRPLIGAIDSHHLHFYLSEDQVVRARDWYVDHFGATPGMRWRYDAADLPGMNLNFSAATDTRSATRGHSLDHVGFEISGLEAFCAGLAAAGVEFDQPFRRVSPDFAFAVLTDPWGTKLELTEGLGKF